MQLPLILVTAMILLVVEVVICRNCPKRSWQAVLPTMVSLTTVFMWVLFFIKPMFTSYVLGLICLIWTGAAFLGWGFAAVWKWLEDRKE